MTYVKTNWKTGDTITADKLNNIENGIASSGSGGGFLVVTVSTPSGYNGKILDKTYAEIKEALSAKIPVYIYEYTEETVEEIGITTNSTIFEPIVIAEKQYNDEDESTYYRVSTNSTYAFFANSEDEVMYNGSAPPSTVD